MSGTTEDEARAALRASAQINHVQQTLTEESRLLLAGILREEMRTAVSEGLEAVLTNEVVWAKVFAVLQRQASERTGRWVLGNLTAAAKRALWVGAFALMVYSIGGWALLKTIWAAMTATKG